MPDQYHITLTFIEPLLGTVPKDPELYASYVASKADDLAEELGTIEHAEEKGWAGFHHDDEGPFLFDYVWKGFCKDACGMLRRVSGTESAKLTAYKKIVDGLLFVDQRRIRLVLPEGQEMGVLERPLRAQTAQGERVALARSDTCPVGTTMEFSLTILGGISRTLLVEWLEYGKLRGLGGWRNSGYGRYLYTLR